MMSENSSQTDTTQKGKAQDSTRPVISFKSDEVRQWCESQKNLSMSVELLITIAFSSLGCEDLRELLFRQALSHGGSVGTSFLTGSALSVSHQGDNYQANNVVTSDNAALGNTALTKSAAPIEPPTTPVVAQQVQPQSAQSQPVQARPVEVSPPQVERTGINPRDMALGMLDD